MDQYHRHKHFPIPTAPSISQPNHHPTSKANQTSRQAARSHIIRSEWVTPCGAPKQCCRLRRTWETIGQREPQQNAESLSGNMTAQQSKPCSRTAMTIKAIFSVPNAR
ncbi:hypothetical protein BCR44DRAFT_1443654 [Catenaria anguillulae PL171]|uniref:Uncharacterized protein n=1 Tax=Catenaria anguillulae PL171 TaxID=765915 RepID=A0A1Y2H8J0_9FUNG|nr:hypothetical protein BCR44DRAFT_1443654 [Catenaria anguillulae PL171]